MKIQWTWLLNDTPLSSLSLGLSFLMQKGKVLTITELIVLREELLEAQHRYNLARNMLTSLDHQKDMLVQMSANKRAEMKLHEL